MTIPFPLLHYATTYQTIAYDYEPIGSPKIDWLGVVLLALLIIAVATFIRGVVKERAARKARSSDTE